MIRNFLFSFFFFFGIILISIIFIPSFFLPQKIVLLGGKLMGQWAKICLQIFLSTKIIIKGKENIIYNHKFFIACSHQSMFETFFLQTIFNGPIFIIKKELLKLPIFGWYLKKIGSISINRNKISKENLGFLEKIKLAANETSRPIIIGRVLSPISLVENESGWNTNLIPIQPIRTAKTILRFIGSLNINQAAIAVKVG